MDNKMMNKPTEEQVWEVPAGTSIPETARPVVQWSATDEGTDYLSRSMDCDMEQVKLGYEESYMDHEVMSDELFARIHRNIRRKRVRRIVFRVAAVLIPFVVPAGLAVQLDKRVDLLGDSSYEGIYVAKDERLRTMFQDGTRVYINSDSRLKYPRKFALSSREVYLEGEAYLVVSKNPVRPSIVNLNGPAIRVLGASFDVNAYLDSKDITVCLDEGHINLMFSSDKKYPVRLGERLVYNRDGDRCTIPRNSDTRFSSLWKTNVIAFKDAPLAEVTKVLYRQYNVNFKVENQDTWNVYFMLTFEDTLLEEVSRDLEEITPLHFRYNEVEKEVTITTK